MSTARILPFALALAVCAVVAVGASRASATGSSATRSTEVAVHDVVSNGGRYVLNVREPEGGFVRGKAIAIEVRITRAAHAEGEATQPATGVELIFDADMPEHLHGLNRTPRVERITDGVFRVEGAYLHMAGWWELYFDVVEGPWTERAQLRVELE